MTYNFYCSVYINILLKYYKALFDNRDVNIFMNYLSLFNLNNVMKSRDDINQFKTLVQGILNVKASTIDFNNVVIAI